MAHSSFSKLFCRETNEVREPHGMAARVVVPAEKVILPEGERADSVCLAATGPLIDAVEISCLCSQA